MKKIYKLFLFFIFLTGFCNFVQAQAKITLYTGRIIPVKTFRLDTTGYIFYQSLTNKSKAIELVDVYATTDADGFERVFYIPDTTDEAFTLNQMNFYMRGLSDGRIGYTSKVPYFTGFVVGAGSAICFPMLGVSTSFSPVVPAAWCAITGKLKVNEQKLNIAPDYKNNQHYMLGYTTSVKKQRLNRTLIGSGIGLLIGLTTAFLIFE